MMSKPKPRLCKNLACFAHSSRLLGGALNFLRQTSVAFCNSLSFKLTKASLIKSSATPFCRSSCATFALPNFTCRACTNWSVKRLSESQPRVLKSSNSAAMSSVSSAYVLSFWPNSWYEYSRFPKYSKARCRSDFG